MIEAAYTLDATLRGFDLDVKHDDGTVTLKGTVQTDQQRARAEDIANQYAASFTVDNQLQVR